MRRFKKWREMNWNGFNIKHQFYYKKDGESYINVLFRKEQSYSFDKEKDLFKKTEILNEIYGKEITPKQKSLIKDFVGYDKLIKRYDELWSLIENTENRPIGPLFGDIYYSDFWCFKKYYKVQLDKLKTNIKKGGKFDKGTLISPSNNFWFNIKRWGRWTEESKSFPKQRIIIKNNKVDKENYHSLKEYNGISFDEFFNNFEVQMKSNYPKYIHQISY